MKLIYLSLFFLLVSASIVTLAADQNNPNSLSTNPVLPKMAGGAGDNPDKEMDEIVKEIGDFHSQAEQMMKQLEKSAGGMLPNGQPNPAGGGSPLDNARRKMIQLASDDRFLKSAQDLWAHPDRPKMLLIQLGFFVFMLIIKAWRQSKVHHWFKRMMLGFVLTIFTWIGIAYVIPAIVLGEPFIVFTTTIFRVVAFGGP